MTKQLPNLKMRYLIVLALVTLAWAKPSPTSYWDPACGYSMYSDSGIEGGSQEQQKMIVGGWPARQHEFPYQVSLTSNLGSHFCGGVLIKPNVVLTAAHCTIDETANTMRVTVGEHIRSQPNINARDVTLINVINHENYRPLTLENDIALLVLSESLPWNNAYRPACQPSNNIADYTGRTTTVSGWGTLRSGGVLSDELMYTNVPIMSRVACSACMDIQNGMVCAGVCGTNDRDSCQGDSGGPLTFKNGQGLWEIVGLVSWGYGCASTTPGVYTDVPFFLNWINANSP